MSVNKLRIGVDPAPHEPAYGLLARLAVRHECAEIGAFAVLAGADATVAAKPFADLTGLAASLTGEDRPQLLRRSMVRDAVGRTTLLGEVIDHRYNPSLAGNFGRVCPLCLEADRRLRSGPVDCRTHRRCWWDVAALSVCHEHRVVLLSRCPSCDSRLDRTRVQVATCRCGHDLTTASTQAVDPHDTLGDGYLMGRLGVVPRRQHRVLDQVTFGLSADMMLHVGLAACWPAAPPFATEVVALDRARAMSAGMRVLGRGPEAFREVLDAMLAAVPESKRSPTRVYGALQHKLSTAHLTFAWLRDELRAHAERNILRKPATRVFGEVPAAESWTTLGQVAIRCRCAVERLETIGRITGILDLDFPACRSTPVTSKVATEFETIMEESMETADAMKALGLSQPTFNQLVAADLLPRAFPIDGTTIPARYRKSDVESLKQRVTGGEALTSMPPGAVTIRSAVRWCCRPLGDILRVVVEGQVPIVGRLAGKDGVFEAVVSKYAVLAALPRETDPDLVSIPEVRRTLGVSQGTIAVLRSQGLLPRYKGRNEIRVVFGVQAQQLKALDASVIGTMRLASAVSPRTHPTIVHRLLQMANVEPLVPAPEPLFPRADAVAVVRAWTEQVGRSFSI
ncbi:TniQ family protein [Lichenibacterium ramalinae]|uniref:TniQ domain-containing protein n=1 Tax=Lichenibacterium ramalinae TaxID=2316527 RepID=A0A4Q2RCV9_9HYPH|nr:TniQ family protein [Lichenibacterium ramalinae]RYB04457.1 hypothetical protein D3272_13560 [Lichenibacterium ramalinae]